MVVNLLRSIQNTRRDNRGFTLAEIMITIVIMGILAGIAIPSWFSVVESRRVDSATNQLVGDLRLANNKASNRLSTWRVGLNLNRGAESAGNDYSLVKLVDSAGTPDTSTEIRRTLPDDAKIGTIPVGTIAFCADGSMEAPPSNPVCPNGRATPSLTGWITIKVTSDGNPCVDIDVNKATSRVRRTSAAPCP